MLDKDFTKNDKPVNHEEIGVVNNEPENRDNTKVAPINEEIGVVNNEPENRDNSRLAPGDEEIGVINNETPTTGEPGAPIIGRVNNEQADKK